MRMNLGSFAVSIVEEKVLERKSRSSVKYYEIHVT